MRRIFIALSSLLFIASFASTARAGGEGEVVGIGVGAVTGGVIGNQIGHGAGRVATTAAGVFAGGVVGDQIGKQFDQPNGSNDTGTVIYRASPNVDYQAYFLPPHYVAPDAPDPETIYNGMWQFPPPN